MGRVSPLRRVLRELQHFVSRDMMNDICEDHDLPRRKSYRDCIDQLCRKLNGELRSLVSPTTSAMTRNDWNDFLEHHLGLPRRKSYEDIIAELEVHLDRGNGQLRSPRRARVDGDADAEVNACIDDDALPEKELVRVADADPQLRVDVQLEDFQREAVASLDDALLAAHAHRERRNGILCLPTGAGKTRTALEWLFTRFVNEGKRVLWVTHRLDLLDQVHREIRELAFLASGRRETISVTRYDGANGGRHLTDGDFVLASVASIASREPRTADFAGGRPLGAVCYDEAHGSSAPERYCGLERILRGTDAPLLGLTATPFRSTERGNENLQAIYGSRPIYEASFRDLIRKGFLAKPMFLRHRLRATESLSLSSEEAQAIRDRKDITNAVLSRLAQDESRSREIVMRWRENRQEYGKTVVFACNIRHAERLAEMFHDGGADAAAVHSELDPLERARRLRRFRDDHAGAPVLVNVGLLTEGWNVPDTRTVLMARPTLSKVLYMQMIGRGSRGPKACPGKHTFDVLDFVDNFALHRFDLAGREVAMILGAQYETETRGQTRPRPDRARFEDAVTDAVSRLLQRQLAVEQCTVWGELRWPAEGGWRSVAVFVETLPALENAVRVLSAALRGSAEWPEVSALGSQLDHEGALRAADWAEAVLAARTTKRVPDLVRVEVDDQTISFARARAELIASRFEEGAEQAPPLPSAQPPTEPAPIAAILDLGMGVAAADGIIVPEEEQVLARRLEALYGLDRSLAEVASRAQAWRAGCTTDPATAANALAGRPYHERLLLLDAMFRVAIADGRLVAEERSLLEQTGSALRLPGEEVEERLVWWKDIAVRAPVVPGFRTCPSCGLTWKEEEDHNFCGSCGARLAAERETGVGAAVG